MFLNWCYKDNNEVEFRTTLTQYISTSYIFRILYFQTNFLGSQWTYKFLGTFLTHFTWLKEKEKIYKTILSSTILQSSFNNLQETDTILLKLVKSLEQKIHSPYMKFM